jgi:hypothetical protein
VSFRLAGLWLALALLGACANQPAPIIVHGPPVDYGPPGDTRNPPQGPFQPNAHLRLCAGMGVSNAPASDTERWIIDFKPVVLVGQVVVASAPANDVCLASGFGPRSGRNHNGIDLTSSPPGPIYAAAPGRILEARESSGYGLQVLIDHGRATPTSTSSTQVCRLAPPSVSANCLARWGRPETPSARTCISRC